MSSVTDFRACLIAIVEHFGKETAIADQLPEGPVDDQGFHYFLEKAGISVEEARAAPPFETGIPFVADYGDGEWAFIRFPTEGRVEVIEAAGRRSGALDEVSFDRTPRRFLVLALRTEPRPAFNWFSRHPWFWGPIGRNRWAYVQVGMASLMTNLLSLSVSIFMLVVYDRVVPNKAWDSLIALTIGVGVALAMDFIIRLIRTHFIEIAGHQVDLAIGRALFDKIFEARIESLRGGIGALANVFKEAEAIRAFFTSATMMTFIDIPFVFMFVAVIYGIAGWLAVIPLLCVPMVLVFGLVIQPLLVQRAADSFTKGRTKQNVVVETLGGLETLRTLTAANFMRRRWMEGITQQASAEKGSRTLANSAVTFTAFIQQLSQVAVIVVGVILIDNNAITMGALVASVMLTARAVAPLASLANMLVQLNHARMAFISVDNVMRAPVNRNTLRQYTRRPKLDGKIEFRNVSFAYPGTQTLAVQGVSFTIQPGEKVALLGRIGSGKSTIARLMLGLYQPNDGAILFDDIDSRQIDPTDVQNSISTVLQDVWLFSGTVRENITIGRPGASDDDMLKASTISTTHEFIGRHPMGYDLDVGERGQMLSGGQRQSITIARALIRDTPFYLMDEPTSMMDQNGEAALIARLKLAMADKTVVVITHRTSMLDLVDRVIVIDQGRVVADGPKSILNNNGAPPQQAAAAQPQLRVQQG